MKTITQRNNRRMTPLSADFIDNYSKQRLFIVGTNPVAKLKTKAAHPIYRIVPNYDANVVYGQNLGDADFAEMERQFARRIDRDRNAVEEP